MNRSIAPPRLLGTSTLILALIASMALVAAFMLSIERWPNSPLAGHATCLATNCFCENPRFNENGFVQPSNTYSSFGFCFVGLLIGISLCQDSARWRRRLFALAPVSIFVGITSAFFHAKLSLVGQFLDVLSMYTLALFVVFYALSRLQRLSIWWLSVGYVASLALCATTLFLLPETRRYLFAILVVIGILTELQIVRRIDCKIQSALLRNAVISIASGYVIWILDNFRIICSPDSLLQGHGIWHFAGAVSIAFLFRYYRSEEVISEMPQ